MSHRPVPPNPQNVQGLVFSGFARFQCCHLLLQFPDAGCDVNRFVQAMLPHVQTGARWETKPEFFLSIGFTYSGLMATDVPMVRFDQFPLEFQLGPTNYYSQQNLCDLGTSAPAHWAFGGDGDARRVDAVVHCYGQDEVLLRKIVAVVTQAADQFGLVELLPLAPTADVASEDETRWQSRYRSSPEVPSYFIHFGYRDGISNPGLEWPEEWPVEPEQYTPPSALNNFLIGYPNSAFWPGPSSDDATGRFAKDGCYNAFRVFHQDVEAFERFLDHHGAALAQRLGIPVAHAREWLAAKLNGRWREGSPLILAPDQHLEHYADESGFGYGGDAKGKRCPFSAHVRVTNPRDQEVFRPELPIPQLLRRGTVYGAPPRRLAPATETEPPTFDYSGERGLVGMFLCGNLGEQFEKVYAWISGNTFSPVFSDRPQDALVANRLAPLSSKKFRIPLPGGDAYVIDMDDPELPTQFVVTRGSLYCFLPSIAALTAIAETRL